MEENTEQIQKQIEKIQWEQLPWNKYDIYIPTEFQVIDYLRSWKKCHCGRKTYMNDNNISKLLTNKGFDKNDLIDIGLCGIKDNFVYDVFRNRIMFPLYNTLGQVVGFSGRIYNGEADSKYVNSKESIIFPFLFRI